MSSLKVLEIAAAEVGYLEKKNPRHLDSKTANAGSANCTKYARDLFPQLQGQPWCDMFVDWCFWKSYGEVTAKALLCGGYCAYTPGSAGLYRQAGRYGSKPKVGAQVFFRNDKRICHTGLVYKVDGSRFYTIEGNTSGASGVIANGGGVCRKSYPIGYCRVDGFGYPDYEGILGGNGPTCPFQEPERLICYGSTGDGVRWVQWQLNRHGAKLEVDGVFGVMTGAAVREFQAAAEIEVDGVVGKETRGQLLCV